MKKKIVLLIVALLLVAPLYAVFGVGDIVFDPTSYDNAVLMMEQLIKNYDQVQQEFNLQTFLSRVLPVDMVSRYQTPATNWQTLQTPNDRFGNLGAWTQQLNQGGSAAEAYSSATVELKPYGSALSQWPSSEQQKLASQYASVEFADSANISAMGAIGQLRANSLADEQVIAALEADSLSNDPAMNTEIGVLNKLSAASVAQMRTSHDSNRLLVEALGEQLAASKPQRDANAAEIDAQINRMEQGPSIKAQYTSTITDTLRGFRW